MTPLPRRHPHRLGLVLAGVLACLLPLAARAQDAEPDAPDHVATPPDSPVGRQLGWVLRVINGEAPGEPGDRFTTRFLEVYAPAEVHETLTTLRARIFEGRAVDLVSIQEEDNDFALTGVLNAAPLEKFLSVYVAIEEKTGKIAALAFNPAGFQSRAGDWDSMGGELGQLAGSIAFGAYEVVPEDPVKPDGPQRLVSIYEFGERRPLAIAGAMRVWVLGALGERLLAGKSTLDDPVTLREDAMCMPGGELVRRGAGATASVRELADRMGRASDTTATDHLLQLLTRDEVEGYITRHARDARASLPLLSLRQMFALKLDPMGQAAQDYATSSADERRWMLEPGRELPALLPAWDRLESWDKPRLLDSVGYFAGAEDLARTLADLHRLERQPGLAGLVEPLRHAPGTKLSRERWPRAAFVKGSEPGVAAMAWLLERDDARHFAMAMIWNNPQTPASEDRLRELARAGAAILEAYEPKNPGADPKPPAPDPAPPAPSRADP